MLRCQSCAQQSGHIVNISAAAVTANYAGFSIYGATKWALEGVSESLAAELEPLGIRVTLVQPGPFRTDFIGRSLERAEALSPTTIAQAKVPALPRNDGRQTARRPG